MTEGIAILFGLAVVYALTLLQRIAHALDVIRDEIQERLPTPDDDMENDPDWQRLK